MVARSHEPRAKIFARSANTLVPQRHCGFSPSPVTQSVTGLGSHSPLGDLQARLQGGERANLRTKCEYPSAAANCSDLNRCRSDKPRVHKDSGLFLSKKIRLKTNRCQWVFWRGVRDSNPCTTKIRADFETKNFQNLPF
jgi:hypothetical protein